MSKQLDALRVVNNEVIFEKANGEIFNHEIGSLLICEIMIDMQNSTTLNRLETGEISKTMRHVSTYNIILESHLEKAKEQFEALRAQGEVEGTFEEAVFATFPYGIVIERDRKSVV